MLIVNLDSADVVIRELGRVEGCSCCEHYTHYLVVFNIKSLPFFVIV
jgi:hypothetical protein